MKCSIGRSVIGAIATLLVASVQARAFNPDPPRDPRAVGLEATRVWTQGDEIIRIDRAPDGAPRRCVRAARLATPDEGGPSRLEFGVERERSSPTDTPNLTMFVRVQYLDRPNGRPLTVRNPILEMQYFGPAADWRHDSMGNGWIRLSKSAAQSDDTERGRFMNEVEKPGNAIVSTFPDGTHRLHHLRGGVSFWHFNMFVDCACRLAADMPHETRDWLLCPKPRRD